MECYKHLRKTQKEDFDPVLTAVLKGEEDDKQKNGGNPVDFPELERQVNEFIVNANAQNYLAPNRVIPKSQRPKWQTGRMKMNCGPRYMSTESEKRLPPATA